MRINSSGASLALSATALFVALGGTAVAVSGQIGTKEIANSAVTSSKLHDGAVTSSKLHNSAVTTNKLANQAVTAAKVAPHTFLAADGTAANASRLGGLLPADFVQGVGIMEDRRVVVAKGGSLEFLSTGFGTFTGNCDSSGRVNVTWSPTVSNAEYEATVVQFGSPATTQLVTLNGIAAGGSDNEPASPFGAPIAITYQIGYTSGLDHVATAYVTGRFEGASCVFIGQEVSSA